MVQTLAVTSLYWRTLDRVAGGDVLDVLLTAQARAETQRTVCLGQVARYLVVAELARLRGKGDAALAASDKALFFSRFVEDRRAFLTALLQRVFVFEVQNRFSAAELANRELMRAAGEPRHRLWLAGSHFLQAGIEVYGGGYERALAELELARAVAHQVKSPLLDKIAARQLEFQISAILPLYYSLVTSEAAMEGSTRELQNLFEELGLPFGEASANFVGTLASSMFWISEHARLNPNLGDVHGKVRARQGAGTPEGALPPELDFGRVACGSTHERLAPSWNRVGRSTSKSHLVRAALAFRQGDYLEAIRLWDLELTAALRSGSSDSAASYLSSISVALWYQGHFSAALQHAAAAVACIEDSTRSMGTNAVLSSFNAGPIRLYYHGLLEMLSLEGRARDAFAVAERARSRSLLRALGTGRDPSRARLPMELPIARRLAEVNQRLRKLDGELAVPLTPDTEAIEQELRELRREHEGLTTRAAIFDPEFGAVTTSQPVRVKQVQAELDRNVTLISFFVTDERIHAWVVERDAFRWVPLPRLEKEVQALACRTCAPQADPESGTRGSDPGPCVDEQAVLERLYLQLFAPLRPFVHHSKLMLIPHGPLHQVPFAALRDPATGRYLIEDFTLTYAPSASALHFLRQKESPLFGKALVLGAPEPTDKRFPPKPGMRREAMRVAKLFGEEALLGLDASEAALARMLDGSVDILHLTAHGIYVPESPRFSRIALSPGDGHDGNLEVHEIYSRLDLSGVNLVVLAACKSATGEPGRGDEIESLLRAFLYAGSPGVISTLWDADDVAAERLMTTFYRRWKAGHSVAEALRGAQLALLRDECTSDPYYWAGYSLTGDPRGRWGVHVRARSLPALGPALGPEGGMGHEHAAALIPH